MIKVNACILMLLPGVVLGASDPCGTARIIATIRPGAEWTLHGDLAKGLDWHDKKQTKPSMGEIEKARTACIEQEKPREAKKAKARIELKDPATPTDKKVDDLIFLMDLDR